jgi:hypothetical protein
MSVLMLVGELILGRYEVLDLIAIGGEGAVARGIDRITGQPVAIKQLSVSPGDLHYEQQVRRLQRAGQIRIGHPGIVDAIDYGEDRGIWYLITPFVEGVDLEMHVRACGGRCSVEQALPIITALADALAAAHRRGIVHRDIKPLNIIITPDGTPKLIDFGICRVVHEPTLTHGSLMGTPVWMSPEQTVNPATVDHRSDLYSLGLVLHFMLTGVPPVQASDPETAKRVIRDQRLPSLRQVDPSIPIHVDAACSRLLAKRPEDRFQTAEEFLAALASDQSASASRYCPACAQPQPSGALFCGRCGAEQQPPCSAVFCFACGKPAAHDPICPGCQRPFSPSDHRFVFDSGPPAGRTYRIPEGIYVVGREAIMPRDFSISRSHVHVACSNGQVHVQDAGSANKTYVASRLAVQPVELRPLDEFLIAGSHAVYFSK